jgi:steroid 5-alpha reductase family enzyme
VYGFVSGNVDLIMGIQTALLVAYGARLSGFLLVRELKNASYKRVLKEEIKADEKKMPVFVKAAIWVCVTLLYFAQTSPVFYRSFNGNVWTFGSAFNLNAFLLPVIGIAISIVGLVIESLADSQKSAQKKENPNMVATKKLYKFVRCPNYFGEILFWSGMFVGSVTSLATVGQWIVVALGYILIVYVMINGAQRLDKRQEKNYGHKEEYRAYADHTPLIVPFIPVYHIGKYKEEEKKEEK